MRSLFPSPQTLVPLTLALSLPNLALAVQTCDQGYCCSGSIIPASHSGDTTDPSNLLCCQGDGKQGIDTSGSAPTTCEGGTQVPLTEVGKGGGSATSASDTAAASSSTAGGGEGQTIETSSGNGAMVTGVPMMGLVAVAGLRAAM